MRPGAVPALLRAYQARYSLDAEAMMRHFRLNGEQYDSAMDGWAWRSLCHQTRQRIRERAHYAPKGETCKT